VAAAANAQQAACNKLVRALHQAARPSTTIETPESVEKSAEGSKGDVDASMSGKLRRSWRVWCSSSDFAATQRAVSARVFLETCDC
jgi:hypothetical protein